MKSLKKIGKIMNLRVVFKYNNSIRKRLMKVKRKECQMNKKGVVYKIPCGKCDFCYVGDW